jgi:hypothetical protein
LENHFSQHEAVIKIDGETSIMPYNVQIIKSQDFVRLDAHGQPDLERSRHALVAIAAMSRQSGVDRALIDVRNSHGQLTTKDLYLLASAFSEIGFPSDFRLAVLHRFSGGDKAETFAMFAKQRGWNVQSFADFEEAFEWINDPNAIG